MPLCKYGCGQEGKYQLKTRERRKDWVCSEFWYKCPVIKERTRITKLNKKISKDYSNIDWVLIDDLHYNRSDENKEKLKQLGITQYLINYGVKNKLIRKCNPKIVSESHRKKISEKRKQILKDNPESHVWKTNAKFISKPCEILKEKLKTLGYNFIPEYSILNYSLDIAFPDKKIAIEVNGNQHYESDGILKPYYQNRHDTIESMGWKILELHYLSCFKEDKLENIINFIENSNIKEDDFDYTFYFQERERKKFEKENRKQIKIEKEKLRQENRSKQILEIIQSTNSDIFQKFGWVTVLSKKLKVSTTQVRRLIKKYYPNFLEKSFQRKKINLHID
jgi:very-short-patch-repair endonuclease